MVAQVQSITDISSKKGIDRQLKGFRGIFSFTHQSNITLFMRDVLWSKEFLV